MGKKLTKKKLRQIVNIARAEIERKRTNELNELEKRYRKERKEAIEKMRASALLFLQKFLENPDFSKIDFHAQSWNNYYAISIWLSASEYSKLKTPVAKVDAYYAEKRKEVNEYYNKLRKKLEEWEYDTLKRIVFEDISLDDLPDWLSELLS